MPTARTAPRLRGPQDLLYHLRGLQTALSDVKIGRVDGKEWASAGELGQFFDKVRRECQRQVVIGDSANPSAAPITTHLTPFCDRNYR
jgi:hypothetical protein